MRKTANAGKHFRRFKRPTLLKKTKMPPPIHAANLVADSSNTAYKVESAHYSDVIVGAMASQITSLTVIYSTVYSRADQRKHQSFASLAYVIHRWPVNSPHKWPVTRKMFPFHDAIMMYCCPDLWYLCRLVAGQRPRNASSQMSFCEVVNSRMPVLR